MARMKTLFSWGVAILVPITLTLLGVRILLTPFFPRLVYQMPNIEPDPYGMTHEERLRWSDPTMRYLIRDMPLSALESLRFDDGVPLYNGRELRHLRDVKELARSALRWGYAAMGALILLGGLSLYRKEIQVFLRGLRWGGFLTLGLVAALATLAAMDFWTFFAAFHHLFFEGETWLFAYSDTLIRLFPIPFWIDVFLFEGIWVIGGALALAFGLRKKVSGV